ncbi:MAG: ABC transporter substrate binding protein [Cycloclasticus sp.]
MHCHSKLLIVSIIIACVSPYAKALDIIIVKTRSLPTVERLLSHFQTRCTEQHRISVYDMQGSSKQGQKILAKIQQRQAISPAHRIFTLGLPATQLIQQSPIKSALFFAMVNDPYANNAISNSTPGFSQSLPPHKLLKRIKNTLPGIQKVAIIHSDAVSTTKIDAFTAAADTVSLQLNSYFIHSIKDLPSRLLIAGQDNDALLLIPDRHVINRHTIEFLVTTAIETPFPIIGYNEHLSKAGLMASISPNYAALGKASADLICHEKELNKINYAPQHTTLSINLQATKLIKPELARRLISEAEHVY